MRIITVSREFGSGGRELGRRLADALDIAYYDKEIIGKIAENVKLDEGYIDRVLERGYTQQYPYTFRRSFYVPMNKANEYPNLMAEQAKIIRSLSKEDCVIVGRGADVLLQEHHPFNIFVYADMETKMRRCRQRAPEGERLLEKELEQRIRNIDKARASNYALIASKIWGDKHSYHLCVNTTGLEIPEIVPFVSGYAEDWFRANGK